MTAYDFIVVGAGSAGRAVAGRLADESSSTVLLIEAGGARPSLVVKAPLGGVRQWGTPTRGCGSAVLTVCVSPTPRRCCAFRAPTRTRLRS